MNSRTWFFPFAFLPLLALAEDAPRYNPYAICQPDHAMGEAWVDRTHEKLSLNVCHTAVWFDRFFGEEGAEEVAADRYIRVIGDWDWEENEASQLGVRVRAKFELPHLRRFGHRISLVFSDEDETDVTDIVRAENEEDPNLSPGETKRRSLGLRWDIQRQPESSFSLSSNIRLRFPFKPSINARYRYIYGFSARSLARFTQNVFWQLEEGFGERTRVDLERLTGPRTLLRWSSSAMYSQESDGLEWVSSVAMYFTPDHRQSMSVDFSVNGHTEPEGELEAYRAGLRYRRNIFRKWLFWQLEPYVRWPHDNDYKATFGITTQLEVLLGRRKSNDW